ncbi:hypothetical protein ACSBR2_036960 [Camellia fascicularis]
MTSSMINGLISSEIRNKALTSVSEVVCDFKDYYGTKVSYRRAWMGVEKGRGVVFGDYSSSFWYVNAANDCNPGSVFDMEFDVNSKGRHFKCLFFSFGACIHSFKYCRPVLMLDGTFLKGRHKGCLLATTVKDGLYQLCFAIVDSKSYDSWHWFLSKLFVILTLGRDIAFVTDRHGGLLKALAELKLMEQFSKRRELGNKWNRIVCPFTKKKLEETFNDTKAWIVKKCSDDIYEIQLNHSVMVDIGKHSCSCRLWEIDSFPYNHGFCAIKRSGKDLNCFLDDYYCVRSYCDSYSHSIYPVPSMWKPNVVVDDDVVLPLLYKRPAGRLRTEKIPSKSEIKRIRGKFP